MSDVERSVEVTKLTVSTSDEAMERNGARPKPVSRTTVLHLHVAILLPDLRLASRPVPRVHVTDSDIMNETMQAYVALHESFQPGPH